MQDVSENDEWTEEELRNARLGTLVRLDSDVISPLHAIGSDWNERLNKFIRVGLKTHAL